MLGMSIRQGESKGQRAAYAWSRGIPFRSLCPQLQTRRPASMQLSRNFEPLGSSFILSRFGRRRTLSLGFSQQESWRAIHNVAFNHRLLLFSPRAGARGDSGLCLFKSFVDFRGLIPLAASRAPHSGLTRAPTSRLSGFPGPALRTHQGPLLSPPPARTRG